VSKVVRPTRHKILVDLGLGHFGDVLFWLGSEETKPSTTNI